MAVKTGLTASLAFPNGESQLVSSMTVRTGPVLLDTTSFGQYYRTRVPGVSDLAGSAVAFVSGGNASPWYLGNGSTGNFTVAYDTGCTCVFLGVVGNIQLSTQAEGLSIVTFDFANTGSQLPAFTWT